jgi:DNA-methyltransferase (dcm)
MKLGSLFDGIGGFPLAGVRNGFTPVWASEIERVPIEITKKHFPDMKHLGDVTQINGAEVEPVDVITFGSPCQDLSIAGKGAGLDGERSGLFLHAIRIIRQMRDATDGLYPRFAIWENVPGAFSSNDRQDFRRVLAELAETEISMPRSGKWANSGMVRVQDRSIAWRVFDSQYWGVPQRRKRIYLVTDFRGQCGPEILFKPESLRGDFEASGAAREEVAGDVGKSFGFQSNASIVDNQPVLSERVPTMRVHSDMAVLHPEIVGTLDATGSGTSRTSGNGNGLDFVIALQGNGIDRADTAGCNGAGFKENVSYALNTVDRHAVAFGFRGFGDYKETAKGSTLKARTTKDNSDLVSDAHYQVRRLTPLECERLQGFPDNWTVGHSDSARYKALGNSVTVTIPECILGNVADEIERSS